MHRRLQATYLVRCDAQAIEERARAIAVEQSVEMPLTAIADDFVRSQIVGIVIGSTIKGLVAGIIIGFFATRVHSLVIGTIFGLLVGAFFAYLILLMNPGHALNIMLPGSLVGLIVGYTAQKHAPAA